ncbi:MAG TPA: hypothetical protein EYP33_05450 [Pyrodictium sp.]|nr:hypothetical protein [Pyrodictium sp.]
MNKKIFIRNGKKKVLLQVTISYETYKRLIEIAPKISGSVKGSLSYVVEKAIEEYLGRMERILREAGDPTLHTHTRSLMKSTAPSNSTTRPSNVETVWKEVTESLKRILTTEKLPYRIGEPVLRRAIMVTRGSDKRTVDKWISIFKELGFIKEEEGEEGNRIFRIISD